MDTLPRHVQQAIRDLRRRLEERFDEQLLDLCLFGSMARGEGNEESDVDVMVLLEQADWRQRRAALDLAADVGLEADLIISATVFDRATYERWREQERPLVMDIERDGVRP